MTSSPVRVRFAPSPTGHLHIGGARTALYNWLFARHHGGVFILRVEDTDRQRHQEDAAAAILASLKWLGLDWDEGPYYQSTRFPIYRQEAERLRRNGQAYRCFCSRERLEDLRARQREAKEAIGYDGLCAGLDPTEAEARAAAGETSILRLRSGNGLIHINDLVHGTLLFDAALLDDFVILKSDGSPTYNFAVAVDDAAMKISHVIRGDDHISNTPKQWKVLEALGAPPPLYAHIPMILGPDKVKLSKRHGAVSVMEYAELGFVPEALVNYLALLGWSFDGSRERFHPDELVECFSLERVSRTAAVFDLEKASWLNGEWLKEMPVEKKAVLALPFLRRAGAAEDLPADRAQTIIRAVGERMKRFDDLIEQTSYLFAPVEHWDDKAERQLRKAGARNLLVALLQVLDTLSWGDPAALEMPLRRLAEDQGVSFNALVHPLRAALTGRSVSFGIFELMDILGAEEVRRRIHQTLTTFPETEEN